MSEIAQSHSGDKKIRSKKASTRIDMTPMVDLAFLLLTFFVMTTSLLKPFIVPVHMPEDDPKQSGLPILEKNVLTVILGKDNKVFWYIGTTNPSLKETDFSKEGIRSVLMQKKAELPKLYVLIKSNDDSVYQNMIDILDEMTICGIVNYAMVNITAVDTEMIASKAISYKP